ncbi:bifunctional phosphoribosylaminoimidazolecarboxamide formyltransferase/IMP cyclohydrolase [Endomicrobium proavitum]|uniref:Bifunctional purine biosynthesis protein PurH n=1 Tax=Endomicrobium proavitum TaxID=1408281 RepID=A0A0G3WJ05_9BACT|nr:bifunctional phosphoribosylaminoimidazolecarboxamide formyltransferase/IMP cyclohydrolase [Endomicrobium proavitum]AKL97875.1 Phosphoribosylaminoimidazolecarboxamide formyltransferase [Endomicrobium proavitum]
MPTALLSVSDKTGIVKFAQELKTLGWQIISSGGTAKTLKENNIECREISEVTGFPEILDGRVKTLNPKIHGGILAIREKSEHAAQLKKHDINAIDIVAVNLYPFEETINKIPKPENKKINQEVIENIDIGGVALLRAAAKNYKDVLVICDAADYDNVIEKLNSKSADGEFKLALAAKAFRHTAYYDSLISNYLTYEKFPSQASIPLKKLSGLRYGENPHQGAALYGNGTQANKSVVISAKQLHGKELSYNNYLDLEAAWRLVHEFGAPACAIIKHNNPCGCAEGENVKEAYLKALECDPVSAFGGIIAFNKPVDADTAQEISKLFAECVITSEYSKEAFEILTKKKNIRLLQQPIPYAVEKSETEYRMLTSGMLVQDRDNELFAKTESMTKRSPTQIETQALDFAWKICKHVKSNAIILVRGRQTVGIGAGQMSRIDSLQIALKKMREIAAETAGKDTPLVLASDAFFPFPDVVEEAAKAGVTAIIQPGGSIKDQDSINAADNNGIAMVATGMRHFKH